jgi:hypothetical protein
MIKFFRHIRRRLLSEGKTRKYFKYAIGEILLVVIGILIALQANNWNEKRKDKLKESTILKAINKDFTKNLELFEIAKNIHYTAKNSAEELLVLLDSLDYPELLKNSNIAIDFQNIYLRAMESHTFNPSNGIVNSLISSGNFQLIQNDTLKNLIISWNDVLEDYKEEELAATDFWKTQFEPFLIEQGSFSNPGMEKAFVTIKSPIHKSLVARRIHYVGNIVESIEKEPIGQYLREIVRLTSPSLNTK